MKFIFSFIALLYTAFNLYSQEYDYNWINGVNPSIAPNFNINFDKVFPKITAVNTNMYFEGTQCSISGYKSDENKIIVSNGCDIKFFGQNEFLEINVGDYWCNSTNRMITRQGMFGIPYPDSVNKILTVSYTTKLEFPVSIEGLNCFINKLIVYTADFDANNGEGNINTQHSVLIEGCFQPAKACKHANGRDWWIILPDNLQHKFYRWLLSTNGLEGPWEQEVQNPTIGNAFYVTNTTWSEFSPNGQRMMIKDDSLTALYDFDRCTGLLGFQLKIKQDKLHNVSGCFSPNSDLLYITDDESRYLWQFDMTASDILGSKQVVSEWDGFTYNNIKSTVFGYMQHGPDGKIYIWGGDTHFMHVVEFPNRKGVACSVKQRAIELPSEVFAANLYYPHYRLGPIDGSICDSLGINNIPMAMYHYLAEDTLSTLSVTFTDASYYEPTSWHWTFGDGSSSDEQNPVHDFASPGTYLVCLIAQNDYGADTLCREVIVDETSSVTNLPALPQARVSPNPATDHLIISMPAKVSGSLPVFQLTDMMGRVVLRQSLADFEQEVSMERLPAGIYFWSVHFNARLAGTGRVVKM